MLHEDDLKRGSRTPAAGASLARGLAAALALWGWAGLTLPAEAHLSIIRQGRESTGNLETGDYHGGAVAAGDFDGDGYDDLAMGAPFEDAGGINSAGIVTVSWGSHLGIVQQGAVVLSTEDLGVLSPDDEFGYALAAGDFNGDGYDDLAVGAPGDDLGLGSEDIGGVYVYHGSASGLFAAYIETQANVPGEVREGGDRFGAVLCAGDLNADGVDDLAVSATGEDGSAGAVSWFRGGVFGLLTGPVGSIRQSNLGESNGAGDQFGYSLAIGNVFGFSLTGEHYDDLVIGAPFKERGGITDAGAVYVVLSTSGGPNLGAFRVYDAASGGLGGRESTGWFGYAVAAGHMYDGVWDGLAVGEAGRNRSGTSNAGRVVVGKGGATDVDWSGAELRVLHQNDFGAVVASDEYFGHRLTAGHFDTIDLYEDLIIGMPRDRANATQSFATGWVGISFGGPAGPGGYGYGAFFQSTCNDPIEDNDRFGHAVCLGAFDGSSRGNLAAGAPGEDSNTGMVHVIAPWRQLYSSHFQTQLAVDCEDQPVFSAKPFDEVCIASTTKIMTVLLACERSQLPPNDPRYVSLDAIYTVPWWIRFYVGGSLYDFNIDETMTLRDLLYCCIFPSGNDAAYAIADILTGSDNEWDGYSGTCTDFVAEMNQRAGQLGMTSTLFTNPAGLDVGAHHSSAHDMILLARAAMDNPLMASVVSSPTYEFFSQWRDSDGRMVGGDVTLNYGFLQGLQWRNEAFRGIKPGGTPCAQITGVFAAESEAGGMALSSAFGYDADLPANGYYDAAAALTNLSLAECSVPLVINPDAFQWNWGLGGLSTFDGDIGSGGTTFGPWNRALPHSLIELFRPDGDGLSAARFDLERSSDVYFEPNEMLTFGIGPFQSHGDILFSNLGETMARFRVVPSYGGQLDFDLVPGETALLPAWGDPLPSFTFTVLNQSGNATALPMNLGIQESYGFELTGLPAQSAPVFSAQLERPGGALSDGFRVTVTGRDPQPGRTLYATLHDEGVVVDVDVDGQPSIVETPSAVLLSAGPNPFTDRARLRFHLRQECDAALGIYDLSGREVRSFREEHRRPGAWAVEWDGRGDDGRALPRGVYFYNLALDGRSHLSGKLTLVR